MCTRAGACGHSDTEPVVLWAPRPQAPVSPQDEVFALDQEVAQSLGDLDEPAVGLNEDEPIGQLLHYGALDADESAAARSHHPDGGAVQVSLFFVSDVRKVW